MIRESQWQPEVLVELTKVASTTSPLPHNPGMTFWPAGDSTPVDTVPEFQDHVDLEVVPGSILFRGHHSRNSTPIHLEFALTP